VAVLTFLPSQSTATAAADGAPSLNWLLLAQYDGNQGAGNRAGLRSVLVDLQANFTQVGLCPDALPHPVLAGPLISFLSYCTQVPDLKKTATLLNNVSDNLQLLRDSRLLDSLSVSLGSAGIVLDELSPALGDLESAALALQASLGALSLSALASAIEGFNATLASAPSLAPLEAALSNVGMLDQVLDCLGRLVVAAESINASVISLPSALDSLTSVFASANASVAPIAAQVAVFNATIQSIESAILSAPNFTQILAVSCRWG
jgi:hypothetical protein